MRLQKHESILNREMTLKPNLSNLIHKAVSDSIKDSDYKIYVSSEAYSNLQNIIT